MGIINHKKITAISVLLIISILCALFFVQNTHAGKAVLSDIVIAEYYDYGADFTVPESHYVKNGTVYETEKAVVYPSGIKTSLLRIKLDEIGRYSVVYSSEIDGEKIETVKYFNVFQKNYLFEKASYENGKLRVTFDASNRVIRFNQPIDVSELTKNDMFCAIDVHTQQSGAVSASKLVVTLTDVYEEDNYVKICSNMHDSFNGLVYHQVCYAGQSYKGLYRGEYGSTIYTNGVYGLPCMGTYYGRTLNTAEYYFDYVEKAAYAGLSVYGSMIGDLDDSNMYTVPWKGFTTGDVYVSVSIEGMVNSEVVADIRKIGNIDLSSVSLVSDLAKPRIVVDYNGFDPYDLPYAVKDREYTAFNAIAYNGTSYINLKPEVYYGYNTPYQCDIDVVNGKFLTEFVGTYSMVYRVKTPLGEIFEKVVPVKCKTNAGDIVVEFTETLISESEVGETVIFPGITVSNYSGKYDIVLEVENGVNRETVRPDTEGVYSYLPWYSGELNIKITVTDYVGRTAERNETIRIAGVAEDKFISSVNLPKYLFDGYSVQIPEITAYNFSSAKYVPTEIYIIDKDGERKSENGLVTPRVSNSLDKVKIVYRSETSAVSYDIPVIKAGEQGSLDLTKFFVVSDTVSITTKTDNISFETGKNYDRIDFANKLLAEKFSFRFNVNPNKNKFNAVNVYLNDSKDNSQAVKLSFVRNGDKSVFYLNDNKQGFPLSQSFTGASASSFALSYTDSDSLIQIDGRNIYINQYLNGKKFDGFSSAYLYVSFELAEVHGNSAIEIAAISEQVFCSDESEYLAPSVVFDGDYGGHYKQGETYNLSKLYAGDVLSTFVKIKYTFKKPDKTVAVSSDGTKLENLSGEKEYSLVLDELGKYTFSLTAEDQNGNFYKKEYVVYVDDSVKPIIMLEKDIPEKIKVGQSIKLSEVAFSDDSGKVTGRIFVITPDGKTEECVSEKYTFAAVGKYKVCYYAYDDNYNVAKSFYTVEVE